MSQKLFKIIIIVLMVIVGVAGILLYLVGRPAEAPVPGETSGFKEFTPLPGGGPSGAPEGEVLPPTESGTAEAQPSEEGQLPGEIKKNIEKVADFPVSGAYAFYKTRPIATPAGETPPQKPKTEQVLAFRYIEKETGNVYERILNIELALEEEKQITTNIIPESEESFFVNKGSSVILRYAKANSGSPTGYNIETFLGEIPKEVSADTYASDELKGKFLEEDIADLSVSPDTLSIFYLQNTGDRTLGYTILFDGTKKTQVFSSPFTEWLSQFSAPKKILLTTKASGEAPGYSYLLDTGTKSYPKIIGGIDGLTGLMSPTAKKIVYSDSNLDLKLYDLGTKITTPLGLRTLPEKCVWLKDDVNLICFVPQTITTLTYPDDWYKGIARFNDEIWRVNTKEQKTTLLNSQPASALIDAVRPFVDEKESYLYFMDKKTSNLWMYGVK